MKQYLKTWFVLDLVTTFPVEWVVMLVTWSLYYNPIWRVNRCCPLLYGALVTGTLVGVAPPPPPRPLVLSVLHYVTQSVVESTLRRL